MAKKKPDRVYEDSGDVNVMVAVNVCDLRTIVRSLLDVCYNQQTETHECRRELLELAERLGIKIL